MSWSSSKALSFLRLYLKGFTIIGVKDIFITVKINFGFKNTPSHLLPDQNILMSEGFIKGLVLAFW